MSNESLDNSTMAGMRGQHQSGLPVPVQRVDCGTLQDQFSHVDGIAPSDRVCPGRIHVRWLRGALNKPCFRPMASIGLNCQAR